MKLLALTMFVCQRRHTANIATVQLYGMCA